MCRKTDNRAPKRICKRQTITENILQMTLGFVEGWGAEPNKSREPRAFAEQRSTHCVRAEQKD